MLKQMEKDNEEEKQSVRKETDGLVNGDMGDGSAEQNEDHSPPQTDRTDEESHTHSTDTESEHKNESKGTDQKVSLSVVVICWNHHRVRWAP